MRPWLLAPDIPRSSSMTRTAASGQPICRARWASSYWRRVLSGCSAIAAAWTGGCRQGRAGDAAAARATPSIAFYSGYQRAHHRQVDLVVTTVQHLVGVCQHGLALCAGHWLGGHRLVGITGQRTTAAFAAKATRARFQHAWRSLACAVSVPLTAAGWNYPGSSRARPAWLRVLRPEPSGSAPAPTAPGSARLFRRGRRGREALARPRLKLSRP